MADDITNIPETENIDSITHPFLHSLGIDIKALEAKLDADWHLIVLAPQKNSTSIIAWFEEELKKLQ